MNDLSMTVAEVLSSPLGDPEAIAGVIRQAEEELAELEAKLADIEGKVLSPATSDDQAEDLSKRAASMRLMVKRKSLALDGLRSAHASAVLRKAKQEAEERRRQVMAERDAVAADLKARYPTMAAELAALLGKVSDSEARCRSLNMPGPEATVRSLGPNEIGRLTRGVILPAFDPQDLKHGRAAHWPPSRPRSTAPPLPAPALKRYAQLGDQARATQEANEAQRARVRGSGPISPEAELTPSFKVAH